MLGLLCTTYGHKWIRQDLLFPKRSELIREDKMVYPPHRIVLKALWRDKHGFLDWVILSKRSLGKAKDEKLDSQRDIGTSERINTTCTIMEMTKRGYTWEIQALVYDWSIGNVR